MTPSFAQQSATRSRSSICSGAEFRALLEKKSSQTVPLLIIERLFVPAHKMLECLLTMLDIVIRYTIVLGKPNSFDEADELLIIGLWSIPEKNHRFLPRLRYMECSCHCRQVHSLWRMVYHCHQLDGRRRYPSRINRRLAGKSTASVYSSSIAVTLVLIVCVDCDQ